MGTVESLPRDAEDRLGLTPGARVVFFPVPGTWQDLVLVDPTALTAVPDDIPDPAAASLLIDVATASLVVRDGLAALPPGRESDSAVVVTGAGSAVGRVATLLLGERGLFVLRLVRSAKGAAALRARLPGFPVVAIDAPNWIDGAREALGGRKALVALDGVGGRLLPDLALLLEPGAHISNFGSLGGADTDIRLFVPRRLTLRGLSIMAWLESDSVQRSADIATAFRLARAHPAQFGDAAIFKPEDVAAAVAAVRRQGKSGPVLLDFR